MPEPGSGAAKSLIGGMGQINRVQFMVAGKACGHLAVLASATEKHSYPRA